MLYHFLRSPDTSTGTISVSLLPAACLSTCHCHRAPRLVLAPWATGGHIPGTFGGGMLGGCRRPRYGKELPGGLREWPTADSDREAESDIADERSFLPAEGPSFATINCTLQSVYVLLNHLRDLGAVSFKLPAGCSAGRAQSSSQRRPGAICRNIPSARQDAHGREPGQAVPALEAASRLACTSVTARACVSARLRVSVCTLEHPCARVCGRACECV